MISGPKKLSRNTRVKYDGQTPASRLSSRIVLPLLFINMSLNWRACPMSRMRLRSGSPCLVPEVPWITHGAPSQKEFTPRLIPSPPLAEAPHFPEPQEKLTDEKLDEQIKGLPDR